MKTASHSVINISVSIVHAMSSPTQPRSNSVYGCDRELPCTMRVHKLDPIRIGLTHKKRFEALTWRHIQLLCTDGACHGYECQFDLDHANTLA